MNNPGYLHRNFRGTREVDDTILIGSGSKIFRVPDRDWREGLAGAPEFFSGRLAFMTDEHHRVRNFVVAELPANPAKPLQPAEISRRLRFSPDRLDTILDELERNLFFLVRDHAGDVSWAFPVTSDRTPHFVRFSNGKSVSAA